MSAIFYNFWPLPPYHRHSSKMLMKGIFDPYVLWPFDHRHTGTTLPLKTCWRLKWMVPIMKSRDQMSVLLPVVGNFGTTQHFAFSYALIPIPKLDLGFGSRYQYLSDTGESLPKLDLGFGSGYQNGVSVVQYLEVLFLQRYISWFGIMEIVTQMVKPNDSNYSMDFQCFLFILPNFSRV